MYWCVFLERYNEDLELEDAVHTAILTLKVGLVLRKRLALKVGLVGRERD